MIRAIDSTDVIAYPGITITSVGILVPLDPNTTDAAEIFIPFGSGRIAEILEDTPGELRQDFSYIEELPGTPEAAIRQGVPEYKEGDRVRYDDAWGAVVSKEYNGARDSWDYLVKFDHGGAGTVWGSDLVRADTPLEG